MHTPQQTMSNGGLSLPTSVSGEKPPFTRSTANFHPSVWGDHFLSFVPSSVESDSSIEQAKLLKEDVRKRLVSPIDDNNFSFKLNFIDSVQRLGVSYHFEQEIDSALCRIYEISTKDNDIIANNDDLYHTALLFRLLRQHGYRISPSVFFKFKDQSGKFKESLANDIEGMLCLYEAAQIRCHGEHVLEEAHNFSLEQLTQFMTTQLSCSLTTRVQHSLRQSLCRGLPRLEATYFMSFYEEYPSHDEKLLTFAKLDFNKLQELHLKEVSNLTKWWAKDLDVSSNLPFTRDRIVECYFWALGVYFEPQYSRWITAKLAALGTIIDDIYDAYGTIEELNLFTIAIDRWDTRCLVDLPKYMQVCYKAILDVYEEIEQEMRKQRKVFSIKYVKKEIEQERQHVVSSIQCYMKEHKISRKRAIEELLKLVENAWKDINDACLAPTQVPMKFLMRAVNFTRVADVFYKDEDTYTNAGGIMKDHIETLLVKKMSV
ncbi:(-)-germacrene D synthase-like isoform X6 [Vigna unguiculata]|uniref:(-)-germacrene D synthase-like isoform X6 n=1 Tax=Vigna unguiculata TaxID=3917 RepID=UPI00101689BC|nr:(-)-germacrene D synthase-like isoform X6 [Vigna unguiculata]